ncbi:DUF3139 domain-containing protein [Pseudobacillus badius]|uniref:DUF3139 domain-containing protein n=1 Tax=Bacillus badius TaxID=1455 RepID=UPI003CF108C6
MNLKKTLMGLLILCFVVALWYMFYQRVMVGERTEREELLEAVVWKLQEGGYSSKDVESITIKYAYFKGGTRPYDASVVFKKDTGTAILYGWKTPKKKEVVYVGTTSP